MIIDLIAKEEVFGMNYLSRRIYSFLLVVLIYIMLVGCSGTIHRDKISVVQKVKVDYGFPFESVFSPDGKLIAVGTTVGVWLYDSHTFKELDFIDPTEGNVWDLAWSPDGKHLAVSLTDTLRILDTNEFNLLLEFDADHANLEWSDDSTRLAFISDRELKVIQFPDGNIVDSQLPRDDFISAAWSPDGKRLVSSHFDGILRIWDAESFQIIKTQQISEDRIIRFGRWSQDMSRLYVFDMEGGIWTWDGDAENLITTLQEEGEKGEMIYVDRFNWLIVGNGFEVSVWDLAKELVVQTLHVNTSIWSLDLDPHTGDLLVSMDSGVQIWDLETGKMQGQVHDHAFPGIYRWSPDGRSIASADHVTNLIEVWDIEKGKVYQRLKVEGDYSTGYIYDFWDPPIGISQLAWSPNGEMLAAVSHDENLYLWDMLDASLMDSIPLEDPDIILLEWSPDSSRLAYYGKGDHVYIWDVVHKESSTEPGEAKQDVQYLSWSPDGTKFALQDEKTLWVWNARTWELLKKFPEYQAASSIAWSPDGSMILLYDQTLDVISTDTWDQVQVFPEVECRSASWLENQTILCYEDAYLIRTWDTDSWKQKTMTIENDILGGVERVFISPDGSQMNLITTDHALVLVDLIRQDVIGRIDLEYKFNGIEWAPGGTRFCAWFDHGPIAVWEIVGH
jgi:WD40 repeat protein